MNRALPLICTLIAACGDDKEGIAPPPGLGDGGRLPDDGYTINGSGGFATIASASTGPRMATPSIAAGPTRNASWSRRA